MGDIGKKDKWESKDDEGNKGEIGIRMSER